MTEPVEFEVEDTGAPRLGEQASADAAENPEPTAAAGVLVTVPGWTQDEAARVVGGGIANLTLLLYVTRWHAAPAPELWPVIAGDPPREFPLLGAGLAPVLDFLAPKGSAAAVGVSLTAGMGEVIGAMARRMHVLAAPPQAQLAGAPAPEAGPPPDGVGAEAARDRFHFTPEQLRVIQRAQDPMAGMGIAA